MISLDFEQNNLYWYYQIVLMLNFLIYINHEIYYERKNKFSSLIKYIKLYRLKKQELL